MNTNTIIAVVIAFVVGAGGGYMFASGKTESATPSHTMSMEDMMASMNAELTGKTGDEFDKAFLTEMTAHHQGAIEMAELAQQNAKHQEIKTMADAIISAQTGEIEQMQGWKASWYGTGTNEHPVHHAQ